MSEWVMGFYTGVAFAAVLLFLAVLAILGAAELFREAIRIIYDERGGRLWT